MEGHRHGKPGLCGIWEESCSLLNSKCHRGLPFMGSLQERPWLVSGRDTSVSIDACWESKLVPTQGCRDPCLRVCTLLTKSGTQQWHRMLATHQHRISSLNLSSSIAQCKGAALGKADQKPKELGLCLLLNRYILGLSQ